MIIDDEYQLVSILFLSYLMFSLLKLLIEGVSTGLGSSEVYNAGPCLTRALE